MTVDVTDVTIGYDGSPVLEAVDVHVGDGELLGLLGPNGSGKTLLLRAIDGLLEPTTGRVTVDGTDIQTLSREEIARRIGYLPQVERTTTSGTVFDTVLLGRNPHFGWRPGESDRRAVESVYDVPVDVFTRDDRTHVVPVDPDENTMASASVE